jgi:hypothetical protein
MPERLPVLLPVHGFVLAGGASSRMGEDKALLRFCGRPMVEIALEKLRGFCVEVGIAGNREDLAGFAPVGGGGARDEWCGCEQPLLREDPASVLHVTAGVPGKVFSGDRGR